MRRYFTKTFWHFFFGFLAILVVAFGVLLVDALHQAPPVAPVDNVALPQ